MVVMKFKNGDRYDGEWEDDMKNGEGTLTYANGGSYSGTWVDDMRNGYGVNIWPSNYRYDGHWKDNKRHGKGVFVYNNGCKYDGEWENDMRHGQGVNKWSNGDRYEGLWERNEKHGKGTLYHANGNKETGVWVNGKLNGKSSEGSKSTDGQVSTKKVNGENSIHFKGFWLNGQPFFVLLMPQSSDTSSGCSYKALAAEYISSLGCNKAFFNNKFDNCYCSHCYKDTWSDVIETGGSKYVIPRGWVRFGLKPDEAFADAHDIWNKWIVSFHGTTKIAAQSIITHRQFCMPGDVLMDGTKLNIRPGHIPGQMFVYTSPTIAYSSDLAYSPINKFDSAKNSDHYETQIVLQCRQKPDSFQIGPETIGAKKEICPHIPNSKIEYFTDKRSTIVAYGLLVRFRQKNK